MAPMASTGLDPDKPLKTPRNDVAAALAALPAGLRTAMKASLKTSCAGDWRRITLDGKGGFKVHNNPVTITLAGDQTSTRTKPAKKAPAEKVAKKVAKKAPAKRTAAKKAPAEKKPSVRDLKFDPGPDENLVLPDPVEEEPADRVTPVPKPPADRPTPALPELQDCPSPTKQVYPSRAYAEEAIASFWKTDEGMNAYLCICGFWHVGHKSGVKEYRRLRRDVLAEEAGTPTSPSTPPAPEVQTRPVAPTPKKQRPGRSKLTPEALEKIKVRKPSDNPSPELAAKLAELKEHGVGFHKAAPTPFRTTVEPVRSIDPGVRMVPNLDKPVRPNPILRSTYDLSKMSEVDWNIEDLEGTVVQVRELLKDGLPKFIPFDYMSEVLELSGLNYTEIEDALRLPERVEIAPQTYEKDKGYPVLRFWRGDVCTVLGMRTPAHPRIIAAYWNDHQKSQHANHTGGGGSRRQAGLPKNPRDVVARLRQQGAEIDWDGVDEAPVSVWFEGQDLGKINTARATKALDATTDYQRTLRKLEARRQRLAANGGRQTA